MKNRIPKAGKSRSSVSRKAKKPLKAKIRLPRITQKTDSHCGPAAVQLLLAHLGKSVTQDQIVQAAGAENLIQEYGTQPKQLARAVARLFPTFQFWFKQHATVEDLETLIGTYHWPVGVDWQGLFYETPEEEAAKNPHGDFGHYSVVIDIDRANDRIVIADPYHEFSGKPRTFSLKWFEQRWWDDAIAKDPQTRQKKNIVTDHFLFVIMPKKRVGKNLSVPQQLGLQLPEHLDVLEKKSVWKSFWQIFTQ